MQVREEFDCPTDATCSCAWDEDAIAAVVLFAWADVLPADAVRHPGCPCGGGLAYQDLGAGGCHWALIIIMRPVEIYIGREFRVNATRSQHAEGALG